MTWFEKLLPKIRTDSGKKAVVPEGVWIKCPDCDEVLYRAELSVIKTSVQNALIIFV